jgi:Kef-type K+ transport system membrane component KefB
MFIAGLELDLHMLRKQRNAAVMLGLVAFAVPLTAGLLIGWALGWSVPATILLGALFSSHTLIVYPSLRDAGLGGNPAVAAAVGATVLTDTLALIVLAVVAGTQTASADITVVLIEIGVGFVVLLGVGLLVLPRLVDAALRMWAGDRFAIRGRDRGASRHGRARGGLRHRADHRCILRRPGSQPSRPE